MSLSTFLPVDSLKAVQFSGKHQDWDTWRDHFYARSAVYRYDGLLRGLVTVPSKADYVKIKEDTTDADEKRLLQAYQMNSSAYGQLLTSMSMTTADGKVAFNIVRQAITTDLPHGDAKLAMQRLDDYYHPKTVATIQTLQRQFDSLKLQGKQDPGKYMTDMECLRMRIAAIDPTRAIDDNRFIGCVLTSLPKEYDTQVGLINFKIDNFPNTVTVGYVQSQLKEAHERIFGTQGLSTISEVSVSSKTGDQALYSGGFKGKCRTCGKIGHKHYQCPMKSAPKSTTTSSDVSVVSSVTGASATSTSNFCRYCKEVGHTIPDCPRIKAKEAKKASSSVQSVANGTQSGNQSTQRDETADVALICLSDEDVSYLFPSDTNRATTSGTNPDQASGDLNHPTIFDHNGYPHDLFKRYTRVMLCDFCVTIGESNPGIYRDQLFAMWSW